MTTLNKTETKNLLDDLEVLRLSLSPDDNKAWSAWDRICRLLNRGMIDNYRPLSHRQF